MPSPCVPSICAVEDRAGAEGQACWQQTQGEKLQKTIIANWKMHKLRGEIAPYCQVLSPANLNRADVYVAPPFPLLVETVAAARASGIGVLAQNVHAATAGAFTGEVSTPMLVDAGAQGAIVGHSERRTLCGEDDKVVAHKVQACLQANLLPILCVGESDAQRTRGETQAVLRQQLVCVLQQVQCASLCVAYEPVWAIGSGKTASTAQVQEAHRYLKECGKEKDCRLSVLYGGSVKPQNAGELMALPDVDGVLVGGASLHAEQFAAIINSAT